MRTLFPTLAAVTLAAIAAPATSAADDPAPLIRAVNAVGRENRNGADAAAAVRRLSESPPAALPVLLAGIDGENRVAANLLRAAAESIADRAKTAGTPLPRKALEAFLLDVKRDQKARRIAYELLAADDPTAADRLIPGLLNDPNPEFRRDAVARLLVEAKQQKAAGSDDAAKATYRKALAAAAHEDQVKSIVAGLKDLGETVDLPRHFGFVADWRAAGPFDNKGGVGFAAVYPPERGVDLDAVYAGQLGEVRWTPVKGEGDYAPIDVAKQLDNWKGSTTYLATNFRSDRERRVEFRLSTPNAWKLWLNGEFLFGREEYHRGMTFDQYRLPAVLKKGDNLILLKLNQNEQTQDWAQGYTVRFRVTDEAGRAVLPE